MNLDINKEYALCLSGGGYKGSYQAGAIKALHDEGYKFNAVVGTSVGALNGVVVAQNEFDKLKPMWDNEDSQHVFATDNKDIEKAIKLNLKEINIFELGKGIFDLAQQKGLDIEPLMEIIKESIDEDKLRKENAKFGLATINLSDKKTEEVMLEDMPQGQLADYLMATSYLPIFKKVKLHGKYYLDGGYYNNTPTNMLVERGYNDIIEIRLNNKEKIKRYNANVISLIPSEDLGSSIVYDKKVIDYNYQLGYYDGLRLAKNAHGYKYIIVGDKTEKFFINKFIDLEAHILFEYEVDMDKHESVEKAILDNFVYDLAKKLGIRKTFSYEKLYISLLEYTANYFNIERFKVYTFEEFENLILKEYNKNKPKDQLVNLTMNLVF